MIIHKSSLEIKLSKLRKISYESEITITINKGGEQEIIYNKFEVMPYQVLVNGVLKDESNNKVKCEEGRENIIVMRFNEAITSCFNMFTNMYNITKIDLSKI